MTEHNTIKSHTRIRFSSGGVAFVIAVGVVLALAMYTQANLLFIALGVMMGGIIVSVLWSAQTLRKLHVERLVPSYAVVDDHMVLRYYLTNDSRLPVFNITIAETWGRGKRGWKKTGPIAETIQRLKGRPYGWVLHIAPRQRIQAEAPCWPSRRGHLRLEKILISSGFPFGLLRKTVTFEQEDDVLVFPKIHRMSRRVMAMISRYEPMGQMQIQRGGGQEEFFALREYRPGDSLRLIDWKHSARTGTMIAREMTLPSPPRLMISLDLRDHAPKIIKDAPPVKKKKQKSLSDSTDRLKEVAIVLAASLICDAYGKGYKIGLVISGPPCPIFPVHHSLPHRTRLLTCLAELDTDNAANASPGITERVSIEIRLRDTPDLGYSKKVLLATDADMYLGDPASAIHALKSSSSIRSRRQAMEDQKTKTLAQ